MMFMNESGLLGGIINGASSDVTGSVFITLLMIVIFIMAIAVAFGISLEYTIIIILPALIAYASQYGEFVAVVGVGLIYIAVIITKMFLFR